MHNVLLLNIFNAYVSIVTFLQLCCKKYTSVFLASFLAQVSKLKK